MRTLTSWLLGLLATFALFVLMNSLVSGGANSADTNASSELQDFVRVQREESVREKERTVPKRPEIQKRPPTPSQATQQEKLQGPQVDLDLPKIDVPLGTGGSGPFIPVSGGTAGGSAAGFGDGDLIPIVRIEPQWPREALINGISGEVLLAFTVLEDGTVEPGSIKVTSAKPPRMFDSAAMRAVARWKFKPMIVDGRPVRRQASQAVKFNIEAEEDTKK